MIKRIICSILFFLLILALILKFLGVEELNLFNPGYRGFLHELSNSFNAYSEIQISNITMLSEVYPDTSGILEVLITIADGFLTIIQFFVEVINILIRVALFLYAFVRAILSFPTYVS